ncbi:MAG TPA: LiaF domain-containing protein [Euzebyales bacterium]|nr:LiaF domain-containing protein [Euzebyales bacterium]
MPVQHRRPHSWARLRWGLAMVGVGVAWLLDVTGAVDVTYVRILAVALIVLGCVVPFVPERGGIVGLGVVLTVLALLAVMFGPTVSPALLRHGAGDVAITPTSASDIRDRYEHGVGDFTLDLQHVELPVGTTRTQVALGAGQLRIRVPHGVRVHVDGSAGLGDVVVMSHKEGGIAPSYSGEVSDGSSERVLDIDAAVGLGRIEVTR